MLSKIKIQKGFTLIEVIVVIALLAILATIVLVAINPAQNSADARNTKRRADVLQILNAVNQYYVAHGTWPENMPTTSTPAAIKSTSGGTTIGDVCLGSSTDTTKLLVPTFIAELPSDPTTGADFVSCANYNTGYTISLSSGNRVTVTAPSTDDGPAISVTR